MHAYRNELTQELKGSRCKIWLTPDEVQVHVLLGLEWSHAEGLTLAGGTRVVHCRPEDLGLRHVKLLELLCWN